MEYTYEAYEDNAGGLHIFVFDGDAVVLGFYHNGQEYEAAQDWCGLMVQGLDPVAEGWEADGDIDLDADYESCAGAVQIASSEWENFPLGIDTDELGAAGTLFAIECGVLYRCPECGEVGKCCAEYTGGPLRAPERCEACGAELS